MLRQDELLDDLSASGGEALLRALFEGSPDGLVTMRADGRIELFNPAAEAMFGRTASEVVGRDIACLMPSPDAIRHDRYVRHYLETGERRIIGSGREVFAQRKDGSVFPIHLTVCQLPGRVEPRFLGFIRDISTRLEAEQRLHEMQAELFHVSRLSAMGEMASVLAHELNQPLTAITNYAQATHRIVSGRGAQGFERILDLLDKTVVQAKRAGQIIHRLREFMAKGETEHSRMQVGRIVEEACAIGLIGAGARGMTVRFAFEDGLPPIDADRIQMTQVLTNLLRNSIDAMDGQEGAREITIGTRKAGEDELEIWVADTGPGLAQEVREQLFQPFVTTKPGGMGIGLSICRSIVRAHGGELLYDDRVVPGTCFRVRLPAAGDPEETG